MKAPVKLLHAPPLPRTPPRAIPRIETTHLNNQTQHHDLREEFYVDRNPQITGGSSEGGLKSEFSPYNVGEGKHFSSSSPVEDWRNYLPADLDEDENAGWTKRLIGIVIGLIFIVIAAIIGIGGESCFLIHSLTDY